MTELEKSKAIIKYIADSKKITPVKLYTNSEIKNSYDCKVFPRDSVRRSNKQQTQVIKYLRLL